MVSRLVTRRLTDGTIWRVQAVSYRNSFIICAACPAHLIPNLMTLLEIAKPRAMQICPFCTPPFLIYMYFPCQFFLINPPPPPNPFMRARDEGLLPRRRTKTCYSETAVALFLLLFVALCMYARLHFNTVDGIRRREIMNVFLPQFSQLSCYVLALNIFRRN
jgi:hypothetical protein